MTSPNPSARWLQHEFRSMNTDVFVWAFGDESGAGLDTSAGVEQLFRQYEAELSRFDRNSDLSQLNRCAGEEYAAGPVLYAALEAALWAAVATGGLYDPTILSALEAAGYDRSFEHVVERAGFRWATPAGTEDALGVTHRRPYDYRSVTLLPDRRTVRRPAGLKLDLGGMGKGWTVDRAADYVFERLQGRGAFLINAGGDLYAGGKPGDERGWELTLEHPLHPDRWMARLHLHDRALATSAVTKRRWSKAGRNMHHLIDPRTGRPSTSDVLSVSVVARRTFLAEIHAKVALLLGTAAGLAYLVQQPDVEGLIYTAGGRIVFTPGMTDLLDETAAGGVLDEPLRAAA